MTEVPDKIMRLGGVRGMIAAKMLESLQTMAQLTYFTEMDAGGLIAKRERLKAAGRKIGYEDLIIQALVPALAAHPRLNGTVVEKEIRLSGAAHVSVAVGLAEGLVAPTLFDAHKKSLDEIAAARADLVDRARRGKLTVPEMTGGTFTISNLGGTRVNHFTPIVNVPQIAILGLGRIVQRPVVAPDGSIVARPIMGLSLTTDHRAVDGQPAGLFLSDLADYLENPDRFGD
jgi:pyruvate dehydrogenase E2 component (dihydrolipoamide acetyltransferase)